MLALKSNGILINTVCKQSIKIGEHVELWQAEQDCNKDIEEVRCYQ